MRIKWSVCILAFLLILIPISVMAENTANVRKSSLNIDSVLMPVETEELGSITIQLEAADKNHPKSGVVLEVVQVADVINGEFVLKEKYQKTGLDLNQLKGAEQLEHAIEILQQVSVSADYTVTTDKEGTAFLSNLTTGTYLIYAADFAEYESIAASLVSLPGWSEEGAAEYHITLFPKHSEPIVPLESSPETGDGNHVLKYVVVLLVALILIIGLGYVLKYRRN